MRVVHLIAMSVLMIGTSVFAQALPVPDGKTQFSSEPGVSNHIPYDDTLFYDVVIARHPIARGTSVTPAMFSVIQMPGDVLNTMPAMQNIFSFTLYHDVTTLSGQYASVDIQPFQPVTAAMISPADPIGTLPWGKSYPAMLPSSHTQTFLTEMEPGAQVDVFALATFVDGSTLIPVRLVRAAEILEVDEEGVLITMSAHDDRLNIMHLADAGVKMLLVPAGLGNDDFDLTVLFEG